MTAQEQQMLQGLTDRVNQTQLPDKDAEAERFLEEGLGRNPDAIYILAQTVLVQQYALDQAKQQIADARAQIDQLRGQLQQAQQPKHATSFLGTLLGRTEEPAPPPPPQGGPQYVPVPNYAPPPPAYGAPVGYGAPVSYGAPQGGGFLRSALQTATGVAAGALAFEGIESLMHGFGHAAGYGQEFGGFGGGGFGGGEFGGGAPREEIVNNYYGDTAPAGHEEHGDRLTSYPDGGRDDSSRFADASYKSPADTGTGNDVSGNDIDADDTSDTSGGGDDFTDDTSSFDDGSSGGDDFGGGDDGNNF